MDKSKVAKKAELKKYLYIFFQTIELDGDRVPIALGIGDRIIGRLDVYACQCQFWLPQYLIMDGRFSEGNGQACFLPQDIGFEQEA